MDRQRELLRTIGWPTLDLAPTDDHIVGYDLDRDPTDETNALWTTLFDHAPCGIAIIDAEGRIARVNNRLCGMLGRSPGEFVRCTIDEISIAGTPVTFEPSPKDSQGISHKLCAVTSNSGRTIWCRLKMIAYGKGRPTGAICYFQPFSGSNDALEVVVRAHEVFANRETETLDSLHSELRAISRLSDEIRQEQAIAARR